MGTAVTLDQAAAMQTSTQATLGAMQAVASAWSTPRPGPAVSIQPDPTDIFAAPPYSPPPPQIKDIPPTIIRNRPIPAVTGAATPPVPAPPVPPADVILNNYHIPLLENLLGQVVAGDICPACAMDELIAIDNLISNVIHTNPTAIGIKPTTTDLIQALHDVIYSMISGGGEGVPPIDIMGGTGIL